MKTIREIWVSLGLGNKNDCAEYADLVVFIVKNHDKIFPDDKEFVGVYWGKLGCWDKTVSETKAIVDEIIAKNEK